MEFKLIHLVLILFFVVNAANFCLYGIDKRKATKDKIRISEKTLLLWSVVAPFGGLIGMRCFHHKTKKFYFYLVNILMCVVQIAAVFALIYIRK